MICLNSCCYYYKAKKKTTQEVKKKVEKNIKNNTVNLLMVVKQLFQFIIISFLFCAKERYVTSTILVCDVVGKNCSIYESVDRPETAATK